MTDHADSNEVNLACYPQKQWKEPEHAALHQDAVAHAPPPSFSSQGQRVNYAEGGPVPIVIRPAGDLCGGAGGWLSGDPRSKHQDGHKAVVAKQVLALDQKTHAVVNQS